MKLYKIDPSALVKLPTDILLAAVAMTGADGTYLPPDAFDAIRLELCRRRHEALIGAGAVLEETAVVEGAAE